MNQLENLRNISLRVLLDRELIQDLSFSFQMSEARSSTQFFTNQSENKIRF